MPAKKAAGKKAPVRQVVVPDTSVLVDGRLTQRIQDDELTGARILIPNAAVAELEAQANQGRESGFAGLDEVVKVQELKDAAGIEVAFVGDRPGVGQIELAEAGEIDAMIRQVAVAHKAKLLTSDRVQAHVARALGLDVEWIRPLTEPREVEADLNSLTLTQLFDEETMSVHLKQDVVPMAKKGTPGRRSLVRLSETPTALRELKRMRREIIEAARRDAHSFIEIERHGATVVQLGNMRIAIAQPPFSEAMEITAVRPVAQKALEDYGLSDELRRRLEDYQRGVFVSGPPGSGKSTFVAAVAQWLSGKGVIVKTMESPRDLQVGDEITQYAPLERDMALTSDVLLLVRPDYVIYDEVRKTSDFEIFADMRLAGVGLVGVTHANRAIDAVQRLIGRVELGMIPQVVDTVIHVMEGRIQQVLDLRFTVKVPAGMVEADLARPVIEVRDFLSRAVTHEIYTYGEQVVVMPIEAGREAGAASPVQRLAAEQLRHALRRFVEPPFEVELKGEGVAALYVPEREIPVLIGRGGSHVKEMEQALGIKFDVRPLPKRGGSAVRPGKPWERSAGVVGRFDAGRPLRREAEEDKEMDEEAEAGPRGRSARAAEITPELRKSKKNIVLIAPRDLAGLPVEVVADGEVFLQATLSGKGELRIARGSDAGEMVLDALARGEVVRLRV